MVILSEELRRDIYFKQYIKSYIVYVYEDFYFYLENNPHTPSYIIHDTKLEGTPEHRKIT